MSSRGGSRGGFGGGRGGFSGGRGGGFGGGGRGGGAAGGRGGFGGGRGGAGGRGGRGGAPGGRGGRGGAAGGRGGNRAGAKVIVERHRFPGVFTVKGKDDAICSRNLDPGHSVYGEKRVEIETDEGKVEYRIWNPFRSKLAASIVGGIDEIYVKPGSKVLYIGAASGTTCSHVSDLIGPEGKLYAVEFALRPGRELVNMAKRRPNIVPIIEDARHPHKYRMLVSTCDVIVADVAQRDQARIVALNASYYLKQGGHALISIKAACIDSSAPEEVVFSSEIQALESMEFSALSYVTLEPYERGHCTVVAEYRPKN